MNALVPQGKAVKKARTKAKSKAEPDAAPSERRRILGLLLVLLAAFILLPELNFSSKQQADAAVKQGSPSPWVDEPAMPVIPAHPTATQVPTAELASFESQWIKQYDDLPDQEQSSVVNQSQQLQARAPVVPKAAYIVQVATMKSTENATALLQNLRQKGYRSFIQESGPFMQVMIGPQLRLEEAEFALQNIQKDLSLVGIIKSYRP